MDPVLQTLMEAAAAAGRIRADVGATDVLLASEGDVVAKVQE